MNDLNIKLQRLLYSIKDRLISLGSGSTPTTDWRVMLLLCSLLNAAIIVSSVFLFVKVSVVVVAPVSTGVLDGGSKNVEALSGVARAFAVRHEEHNRILSGKSTVLDPSL